MKASELARILTSFTREFGDADVVLKICKFRLSQIRDLKDVSIGSDGNVTKIYLRDELED